MTSTTYLAQKVTDANGIVLYGGEYYEARGDGAWGVSFTPWFTSFDDLVKHDASFSEQPVSDHGQVSWSYNKASP